MYHPKLLKVYYTIFKKVYKFQQQLNAVEKVTGRRPTTLLKMRSFFFKNFQLFLIFFIFVDILSFRNSSDQRTPLIGCFRRNQSIDLQIEMHVWLIYTFFYKQPSC